MIDIPDKMNQDLKQPARISASYSPKSVKGHSRDGFSQRQGGGASH